MVYIISIQGNIGSGKSSLLNKIKNYNLGINKKICYLQEPVLEWENLKDEHGNTLLELYYKDQKTYSFSFQIMAFMSRLKQLKDALRENYDIIITERSLSADHHIFTKMLLNNKLIKEIEYQIYLKWINEYLQEMPQEYIIYIHTSPEKALERVISRNRKGETITLEYLATCHHYHENWLNSIENKFVIDGNYNIFDPIILSKWLYEIKIFITNILIDNTV